MSKKNQIIFSIVSLMILTAVLPVMIFGQENQSEIPLPVKTHVHGSILFIDPQDMPCDITYLKEDIKILKDESAEVHLTAYLSTSSVNEIERITVFAPDKYCRIIGFDNQTLIFKTQYPMLYEIPGKIKYGCSLIFENIRGYLGSRDLGYWGSIDLDYQIEGFEKREDFLKCCIQNCLSGDFNEDFAEVRIEFPNNFRLHNEPLYLADSGPNYIVLQVMPATTDTSVEFYVEPDMITKIKRNLLSIIGVVLGAIAIILAVYFRASKETKK